MDAIQLYFIQEVEAAYKKMEDLQQQVINLTRLNAIMREENQEQQERLDQHEDDEEDALSYIDFLEARVVYTRERSVPNDLLRRAHRTGVVSGRLVVGDGREYRTLNMREWQEVYDLTDD